MRYLLFFLCLLLSGCSNTDPTTGTTLVTGQVVVQQSQQPVGNGTVQVHMAGKGGGYTPVGDPQPCDAQGRFSFHFDAKQERGHLLMAQAPPGYITEWTSAPELTAGRKNQNLIVPVLAPAWVKLVLVDEPPKSQITLSVSGYEGNSTYFNPAYETELIKPCLAGLTKRIVWAIIDEKGVQSQFRQDIALAPLDTLTIRIPF